MKCAMLQIRGGVERDAQGRKAGKGALVKWEHSPCLAVAQDTTLFVFGCLTQSEVTQCEVQTQTQAFTK